MQKRWLVMIIVLLLTGCSTQFFYNRLDWFAAQYVDRYISLNDAQQTLFKQAVVKVRHWHRKQQIPLYIATIDRLLLVNPAKVSPSQVEAEFLTFRHFSQQVAHQVIPELYPLFMSLAPAQADELFEHLGDKYQEELLEDQALSPRQRQEKSTERMQETLEKWMGDLSESQQALIRQWSQQRPAMRQDWIKQQQINKSELQVLYLQRNQSNEFKSRFISSLQNLEGLYTAEFAEKVQRNRQLTFEMVSQVIQLMTPKQLEHYHNKLRDWKTILEELHAQG